MVGIGMDCLLAAASAGLTVTVEGDRLIVRGPKAAEPVAKRVLANKPAVIEAIKRPSASTMPEHLPPEWHFLWDERAAIMEYDGKMPRERAEAMALEDILGQMRREGYERTN
jgi:hypothetical protein